MKKLYIGVMSGTSLDGIDIALCEIDASTCKLLESFEYEFDKDLKKEILHLIHSKTTLKQIGRLDNRLGHLYAKALNTFIEHYKIKRESIEAVGLHGQTLWHEPFGENPFSMQLGCPNVVSAQTGLKVVADFRRMDIANGGEGAPFAPAFHQFLFASFSEKMGVLNLGGMANITILGKKLRGWDCGPGNVLMDLWISKTKKKPYDKGGKFAASGQVHKELLESMLSDNYFHKEPPKSCGREKFNKNYLNNHLGAFEGIKERDVQRTLLELSVKAIAKDVKENKLQKLIVCGGGSKNKFFLKCLAQVSRVDVYRSDDFGVSSDFLEAMAFAWLAYKRIHNEAVSLKSVTGAKKDSLLGGIYG